MKKCPLRSSGSGFTLIEMLIVIAIIAVLYTAAAAHIFELQMEARIARANGDLRTLQLAIETYLVNNKACPRFGNYQLDLLESTPQILTENLKDPFGPTMSTLYSYDTSPDLKSFVAYSVGAKMNGRAFVGNGGRVSVRGTPIIVTNGYM